jgi:multiple sugar transport system ATP-binding protein
VANISLKSVSKVYSGKKEQVEAVRDFSLEIGDREFVVLVGPSGCGKSTTLRMIAGLEEISGGEIRIGDTVVNDVVPKDRDIAMVFQNYALYPHMSVYENLAFSLTLRKIPKAQIKERVNKAAEILDIQALLKRKPKELSGGQCQRVALGRAIVRDPKAFLLDEPLSNLDAKLRTQMRTEISTLHKTLGTTFVYVTHDQTEAMTMADRIVVMKDGVIQQVDTPARLYNCPCNLFVAGFIGSPQMNFFEATLRKNGSGYAAEMQGHMLTLPEGRFENAAMETYTDRKISIGIRPEDIGAAEAVGSANVFEAELDIVEMLGSEMLLYFTFAGSKTIARFPAGYSINKEMVRFTINAHKAHLFDFSTGDAITENRNCL